MRSCGALSVTTPSRTGGQVKLPASSRLVTIQRPEPSHRISLIRSVLFARNTKTSPANGSAASTSVTRATSPSMPFRKSIGLDATITRSPGRDGMPRITVPVQSAPAFDEELPDRHRLPPESGPARSQPQSIPRLDPGPTAAADLRPPQRSGLSPPQFATAQNEDPAPPPAQPSPCAAMSKPGSAQRQTAVPPPSPTLQEPWWRRGSLPSPPPSNRDAAYDR
jgi:hypothetical protein